MLWNWSRRNVRVDSLQVVVMWPLLEGRVVGKRKLPFQRWHQCWLFSKSQNFSPSIADCCSHRSNESLPLRENVQHMLERLSLHEQVRPQCYFLCSWYLPQGCNLESACGRKCCSKYKQYDLQFTILNFGLVRQSIFHIFCLLNNLQTDKHLLQILRENPLTTTSPYRYTRPPRASSI